MKKFRVWASEVVIYEEREIEAKDEYEAKEKYRELFFDPETAPQPEDSNSFEPTVEEI